MNHIVDVDLPRLGLVEVLEKATAEVNAAAALETEPAADDEAEATNGQAQVHDFAPPTDPERMRRLTNLTGQMIREACKGAGKAVLNLVDEAEREIDAMAEKAKAEIAEARKAAQEFDAKVNRIGGANADGIEEMLARMSSVHTITDAVRKRVTELTNGCGEQQAGKAA